MKNPNDPIENWTRDLSACSTVPQPTAPPRATCICIAYRTLILSSHNLTLQSTWQGRKCADNSQLTPWSRILVEKFTVSQLFKKFPVITEEQKPTRCHLLYGTSYRLNIFFFSYHNDARSNNHQILSILWNQKVHFRVRNRPSLVPILNQINIVRTLPSNLFKINFNIILPSTPTSSELSFPSVSEPKSYMHIYFSPYVPLSQLYN